MRQSVYFKKSRTGKADLCVFLTGWEVGGRGTAFPCSLVELRMCTRGRAGAQQRKEPGRVGLSSTVLVLYMSDYVTALYVGRRTRAQACRPRRGGQNKLLFKTHTKETAHSRAILLPLILSGRCRDTPITVARNHSHAARAHGTRRVAGLLVAAHGMACGTLNLTCSPQSIKGKLTAL